MCCLIKRFPYCVHFVYETNLNDDIYIFLKGSDFGICPFLFDNMNNLLNKFNATATPVIAYGNKNFKNIVRDFDLNKIMGNGFLFDHFSSLELYQAIKCSLEVYHNSKFMEICRNNCEQSIIGIDEVAIDWCKEFCRLKGKIFFKNKEIFNDDMNKGKYEKGKYKIVHYSPMKYNYSHKGYNQKKILDKNYKRTRSCKK